jgi:hypothetical protein
MPEVPTGMDLRLDSREKGWNILAKNGKHVRKGLYPEKLLHWKGWLAEGLADGC